MRLRRSAAGSPAASTHATSVPSGVTRRRLLQTGGAASAAALFGLHASTATANAQATAADGTPFYLLRSSYAGLKTADFDVSSLRSTTLTLKAVEDLTAASVDRDLASSEDAFALAFSASRPLEQGIHFLNHPQLGGFELFIAPVANGAGYEAVVNRSRGATRHYPAPRPGVGGSAGASRTPPRMHAARGGASRTHDPVRRISLRRIGTGVVCEVLLAPPGKNQRPIEHVSVWVKRGDKLKAALSRSDVHGRRVALRLPRRKTPLRSGSYEVAVAVTDKRGRTTYERATVAL
jgi:hypothetical protein